MFPTFLGIGAPKAGTTWLYGLLDAHPDVVMSQHRKEIHYFDLHFDRGPDWYEGFFPGRPDPSPSAIGEFTPHYLYGSEVPERISSLPSIDRFIVIIRNPVDRAFSHFRFRRRQDNQRQSFEEFLAREPNALGWGHYGRHLARWYDHFGPERLLVLVFEEAFRHPTTTASALAEHLGLDPGGFRSTPATGVNEAFSPRHKGLYAGAVRRARWLRRHDLDLLITLAKRTGLTTAVKRPVAGEADDVVAPELRRRLWDDFEADVAHLEVLTGIDLSAWRPREH